MNRKVYAPVDKNLYPFNLRKVGREKRIYSMLSVNDSFIRWNNRRIHLSDFMRVTYPIFYEDETGRQGYLSACLPLCNYGGVYIELLDGEYVQLWEEVAE